MSHTVFTPAHCSVQISTIEGASAINIILDRATAQIELRAVPGEELLALLSRVIETAADAEGTLSEVIASCPALYHSNGAPLAELATVPSGSVPIDTLSYGTETGLFQATGIPPIVCGPGDISRTRKSDGHINLNELYAAQNFATTLGGRLSTHET